jgi:hypothetical protein
MLVNVGDVVGAGFFIAWAVFCIAVWVTLFRLVAGVGREHGWSRAKTWVVLILVPITGLGLLYVGAVLLRDRLGERTGGGDTVE